MIVQCPTCRELAHVERALIDEEGTRAGLACSACHAVTWLPAERTTEAGAESAPSPSPPLSPSSTSPSPLSPVDPVVEEALSGLPASGPEEERLIESLRALLPRWDDESAHRALIRQAHELGALPALGLRYRKVLEVRPGDEAAKRAQQEILNLALASFHSLASPSERDAVAHKRARTVLTLVALALLAIAACGFLYFLTSTLQGL